MDVFIVLESDYEYTSIRGVFTSEESATALATQLEAANPAPPRPCFSVERHPVAEK